MDSQTAFRFKPLKQAQVLLKKCPSEDNMLETLMKLKPKGLGCGNAFRSEFADIDEDIRTYIEQFRRKGLTDKAERFQYLVKIMKSKLQAEPETFYSIVGFLLELERNSTDVLKSHDVKKKKYSSQPDLIELIASESQDVIQRKRNAEEFRLEMVGELKSCIPSERYSSDSELSEWSAAEDDDETEVPETVSFPVLNQSKGVDTFEDNVATHSIDRRLAGTLSEDSKPKTDFQSLFSEASSKLKTPSALRALNHPPAVSSYRDLVLKFGEYWECQHSHNEQEQYQVALEDFIVQEIVWHINTPGANSSLFQSDWSVQPGVLTSSVAHKAMKTLLTKFGDTLRKRHQILSFLQAVRLYSRTETSAESSLVLDVLCHGVSTILAVIVNQINVSFERCLHSDKESAPASTSTLLQIFRNCMQKPFDVIDTLDTVLSRAFGQSYSNISVETLVPWITSLRVVSAIEACLKSECRLPIWKHLFYLFCQCTHVYLQEIFSPFYKPDWAPACLYTRNENVSLHDAEFWDECIITHPYVEATKQVNLIPPSFLKQLHLDMLSTIKILEMFKRLEQDSALLVQSDISPDVILKSYLSRLLPNVFCNKTTEETSESNETHSADLKTFHRYVNFLHLSNKQISKAFVKSFVPSTSGHSLQSPCDIHSFSSFAKIPAIPTEDWAEVLSTILLGVLDPFIKSTNGALKRITADSNLCASLSTFQEVILAAREDFSQSIIQLAKQENKSTKFTYEPEDNRNPSFQKILNECYPEGRELFEITFITDTKQDLKFRFAVKPLFPLNLVLTPDAVKKYMFVSHQLLRIRKALWGLNNLRMKDCKPLEGVILQRAFMLRFSFIHFCSSLRAFLMFKILSSQNFQSDAQSSSNLTTDLDQIVNAHEKHLQRIDSKLMRIKFMHAIVIQKVSSMADFMQRSWTTGISLRYMIKLEDCLKQCWSIVHEYSQSAVSSEFMELYYYVGPPPSYL